MEYCKNWEKIRARHSAFWRGEREGPMLLSVTCARDNARFEDFPFPTSKEARIRWWTDAEWNIKRNRSRFADTYFAGDAFPVLIHDLGPAGHAGFFEGAQPRFEGSIWYDPSLRDYADLRFDPDSFLYKKTLDMAREYVCDAGGDYIVSMPDTVGDADVLSHLRGPDNFMMDLIDRPDEVKEALKKVQAVWENIIRSVSGIVMENNDGGCSVGWLQTWAPGVHGQLQCDLSVMLSPGMFGEFLRYELTAQSEFLDNSLYHLDGRQQVAHLDHILSVPKLRAVQWTNIAGQQPVTAFLPVLKRIQAAGKSLVLDCSPDELATLMEHLSSSKMYIRTWAQNEAEAEDIVRLSAKLSRD